MSAVDVLAVAEEVHANAKHSPLWCPAYESDAAQARAAVAELMEAVTHYNEGRKSGFPCASGKFGPEWVEWRKVRAALARCKGEGA